MKINEIFYSVQGEGELTGTPAIFVRFSGCNLACPFCDTAHHEGVEMSEEAIADEVGRYPAPLVVVTGGEPSLFLTASLVEKLHKLNKRVAVETNGTHPLPDNVDWITCSPKGDWVEKGKQLITDRTYNEVKVVYDGTNDVDRWLSLLKANRYSLQPCDTGHEARNQAIQRQVVQHCLENPIWHISLQTHKLLHIR